MPAPTTTAASCAVTALVATAIAGPPVILPDPSPDPYGSIGSSALLTPHWIVVGVREKRFLTPERVMHSYGALLVWPRDGDGEPNGEPIAVWPLQPFRGARFGESCAVQGTRLLVGEPGYKPTAVAPRAQGRAQIVDLALDVPVAIEVISAQVTEFGLEFGTAVALDGDMAAITAPGYTPEATTGDLGATFIFVRETPREGVVWTPIATLLPPEPSPGIPAPIHQGFGSAVALHSTDVLVGAPAAIAVPDLEHGRVYVFDRSNFASLGQLTALTPTLGDRFGATIAHAGSLVAIAAPGNECGLGSVYVFRRGPSGWNAEATLAAPGDEFDGWGERERVIVGTGGVLSGESYGHRSAVYRRTGPTTAPTWVIEAILEGDPSNPTGSPVAIDPMGILACEPSIGLGQVRYLGLERLPDLDFDGAVGASDLAVFLGSWGEGLGSPADFNGDGQVDQSDLAILLGGWS
jgi:hypothetical protein